jgi:hypothetical protein
MLFEIFKVGEILSPLMDLYWRKRFVGFLPSSVGRRETSVSSLLVAARAIQTRW